jgi:hydrogenase nickel incorporation protein HypA/HybF
MHELSVTESILDISLSHAQKANAKKVTQINLVIGRLSSIIDDSIQFYWELVSEGTLCAGSTLHFTRIPAVLHCTSCSTDFEINEVLSPCPHCGGYQTTIKSGEEFYIDSIEVEKDPENTL